MPTFQKLLKAKLMNHFPFSSYFCCVDGRTIGLCGHVRYHNVVKYARTNSKNIAYPVLVNHQILSSLYIHSLAITKARFDVDSNNETNKYCSSCSVELMTMN